MSRRALVAVLAILGLLTSCTQSISQAIHVPKCRPVEDVVGILAQSVPSAKLVPCVEAFPVGWDFGSLDVRNGEAHFTIDSDRAGVEAVEVTFTESCDVPEDATEGPPDEPGTQRFERITDFDDRYAGRRYYVFVGGCVTYDFDFSGAGRTALAEEISIALGFLPVEEIQEALSEIDPDLRL